MIEGERIEQWQVSELKDKIKATELERDDVHREMMDLRYQLELAKAA